MAQKLLSHYLMPRRPRNISPGQDVHTIFRSIDNSFLFEGKGEQNILLRALYRMAERYGTKVYAWVGMSNHHHIFNQAPIEWPEEHPMAAGEIPISIGHIFRDCFSLFARWLNAQRKRVGGVIRDRTKTVSVKSEEQAMTLLIYIFLNPVRAGIVQHPRDYPFHNYNMYAYGKNLAPSLFSYHPAYLALGGSWSQRRHRFRALVEEAMATWGLKRWVGASASQGPGRNLLISEYEKFIALAKTLKRVFSLAHAPPLASMQAPR